jgi:protein-tyrosine-phosphatase
MDWATGNPGRALQGEIDRLADEFQGTFSRETVARCACESLEQLAGARVTTFLHVFAYRFARERLHAQAAAEGRLLTDAPRVLFVCTHNAARSQMAAALTRHLSGGEIETYSAGSHPAGAISPTAVAAMAELGIDIADEFPKPVTDEVIRAADVIVTMGCGDACPLYPGKKYEDWDLDDPAERPLATVPRIRDEIQVRVHGLLAELDVPIQSGR